MKTGLKLLPETFLIAEDGNRQDKLIIFELLCEANTIYVDGTFQTLHLCFDPSTDFELAIKQASQLAFPNPQFQGCYYHFCQAITRKIQTIVDYQNDTLRSSILC